MTKQIIRVGSFFLALVIGIQSASLLASVVEQLTTPAEMQVVGAKGRPEIFATTPVGINLYYIGLTSPASDFGTSMRFLIVNNTLESITCIGYSGRCASPEILIRGHDAKAWVCMRGSTTYSIKAGDMAELIVSPYDFETLPHRSEQVVIGFDSDHTSAGSTQYLAEPMILPTEFRKEVKRELDGTRFK